MLISPLFFPATSPPSLRLSAVSNDLSAHFAISEAH
jgi:hypothetical protein